MSVIVRSRVRDTSKLTDRLNTGNRQVTDRLQKVKERLKKFKKRLKNVKKKLKKN